MQKNINKKQTLCINFIYPTAQIEVMNKAHDAQEIVKITV